MWALRAATANAQCQWADGLFPLFALRGVDGEVHDTAVFDDGNGDALYLGGSFTVAGDVVTNRIAKWNGSNWSALGSGMNGTVSALTVFDDGYGSALYAAGDFTTAGGLSARRIAKWNGSNWSALGSGMNDDVYVLAALNNGGAPVLFAGGIFSTAGGIDAKFIAQWDGAAWSPLGSGTNNTVSTLTVFNDGSGPALYAGGHFTAAGGIEAHHIAKWNGSSWSPLGSGVLGYYVGALTTFDDGSGPALYAGGWFGTAGSVSANHIAKWSPGALGEWSALGSGMDDPVLALTVFDDGGGPALYAGGNFTVAAGASARSIAKWNGSTWSALGAGTGGDNFPYVYALTSFDDGSGPALYAGGAFTTPAGVSANHISRWNGSSWSPLGSGMNDSVFAMTVFDDSGGTALYAGGRFSTAGGVSARCIAKWNGSTWSALGSGMGGVSFPEVNALVVFDDGSGPALYAGGFFTTAGGVNANYIAKWNGSSWSPLGSEGMGSYFRAVETLTVFDDGGGPALYAGGYFHNSGGFTGHYVAKWNPGTPGSWSALGSGMNSFVNALTVFDDGSGPALYVGGDFSGGIREWNPGAPGTWSHLGAGIEEPVFALTVFDDGGGPALYAGGYFSTATGAIADYVAKWNGSIWSPLGSGMNRGVRALMAFDDDGGPALYAGGYFTTASENVSAYVARWSRPDEVNIAEFTNRMTGPTVGPGKGCQPYDFQPDADVDLHDYQGFLFRFEND